MKELGKMLRQAKEMQNNVKNTQKELEKTIINAESKNGYIKLEISCSHKIKSISIEDESLQDKIQLEKCFIEAFNDANKTVFDSFGNEVKVETKVKLSDKELKREIKNLQKKLKEGKKKGVLSEDEIFEIEDKLEELQGNA